MENLESTKPQINKIQNTALIIGLFGIVATVFGALTVREQFFQSYLLGYMFWIGFPLGSLVLMALHHMVSGGWGFVIQRILEASSRTIPLMLLLFIPILFGMQDLFIWARPEVVAASEILQHKQPYLNIPFFTLRAAIAFGAWSLLTFLITGWSKKQDGSSDGHYTAKMVRLSGPTILIYVITMTFMSFDWAMSLDPYWFSTIFGFVFVIGQVVLTLSFAIVLVSKFGKFKPISDFIEKKHTHDLGNLLLAFISLWAYMNVSQFLIIWSGNLPEEIPWYIHRMNGGWGTLIILVLIFHFAVPFALLLLRRNKRNVNILSKIAYIVILVRFFDLLWIIAPNFHEHGFHFHWLDIAVPVGMGGLWVATFAWLLKGRELMPLNDPRLEEVFSHE